MITTTLRWKGSSVPIAGSAFMPRTLSWRTSARPMLMLDVVLAATGMLAATTTTTTTTLEEQLFLKAGPPRRRGERETIEYAAAAVWMAILVPRPRLGLLSKTNSSAPGVGTPRPTPGSLHEELEEEAAEEALSPNRRQ